MKGKELLFGMGLFISLAAYSSAQASGTDTVNSKTGVESTVSLSYFKMGDMRLINNDWGSKARNCNTPYKIFIKTDKSFGWEFNRGSCGGSGSSPDFPEVEFGIHPFGTNKSSVTSPDFTSTKLLPLQIKDINSASVKVDQMTIELQNASSWDMTFEMWFTNQHPITGNHSCAVAEIMLFWGWSDGYWPCDQSGTFTSGGTTYALCHKADGWGCGWKYYQYRMNGGPARTYNSKLDVKAVLDHLVNKEGMSKDLWVSRFEVGTEIDDNTSGKVTIKSITFEVNGVSKSPEFYTPTGTQRYARNVASPRRNSALFPAGTLVAMVNMRGEKIRTLTGDHAGSFKQLGNHLSKGVYVMYGTDGKVINSGKAKVFPVLY
jgi:hypothetical protein